MIQNYHFKEKHYGYKSRGKVFKTKTTLQNYCKFVLNNAEKGKPLEGEWFDVVDDVLRMQRWYDEIVGMWAEKYNVKSKDIKLKYIWVIMQSLGCLRMNGSHKPF